MQRDNTFSDYYLIDTLVDRCKVDNTVFNDVLGYFLPLLTTYSDLFKGRYYGGNSVLKFLKFYGSIRPQAIKNKYSGYLSNIKAYKLFKLSFSTLSYEDFMQEVLLALWTMITRYKKRDTPSFNIYISNFFHFVLLERLKKYSKNESINGNIITSSGQHEYNIYIEQFSLFEQSIDSLNYNIPYLTNYDYCSDDIFDHNWVIGMPNSLFCSLTSSSRQILIDYYIHGDTDQEIANKYGLCRLTINRIRQKAKKILSIYI